MRRRFGVLFFLSSLIFLLAATAADWEQGRGFRFRDLNVAPGRTHLTEMPSAQTGLTFRSDVPDEKGMENSIRLAGTGVAAGDVDGDGNCDLFFCSMGGKSALFRNLGNWRFEDITASAGVACEGQDSTGAAFADIDGDGDLDLLVNSIGGGTRLFLNDGRGRFTEATDCGLLRKNGSISMALADIDGNGTLDLYVVNYAKTKIEDRPTTKIQTARVNGQLVVSSLDGVPITSPDLTNRYFIDAGNTIRELGEPDTLYLNDGHGKFKTVSWTDGTFIDKEGAPLKLPPYDWGLSAMFRDMNGDGAPDLYVCNDLFSPDRVWINDGKGHFRELGGYALRQSSLFSMGIDFADINRDGFDDFIVVDMLSPSLAERKVQTVGVSVPRLIIGKFDDRPQYKRNTLYLNRGDNTYTEIGQLSGIEATGWSWSPVFLDVDLDGFEDLLVTAGYYRDALNSDAIVQMKNIRAGARRGLTKEEYRELKKLFPPLPQQNRAFRNRGDLTFEEKSADWGFADFGISQAICLADLDNDGDLDVVVVRQNGPVALYKNEASAPRLEVRLRGKAPNTLGIGAKIKLIGGSIPQSQEMICGGRYLSSDDTIRAFAVPGSTKDLRIEVTWRSGATSTLTNVKPNRIYEIDEAGANSLQRQASTKPQPLFEDKSTLLNHSHFQAEFDDFQRQPTLPQKLSQSGPGVSWIDLNGDGRDDLVITAGVGGSIGCFQNAGGAFTNHSIFASPCKQEAAAILGLDDQRLIVAWSNYEDARTNSVLEMINISNGASSIIASVPESIGPMCLADVNGDGELDLFVGGRVIAGRYPEPASSHLYIQRNGQFFEDAQNRERFSKLGLVSGAVFSDLDGDGFPELILACEWGPLRIFHNDHGAFSETTRALGLSSYTGLWNGVCVGDFDGDGRMDIAASNLGRNTKFQSYRTKPLRLYYGAANSGVVCFVASFDDHEKNWLPHCDSATAQRALPSLAARFNSFKAYSVASADELLASEVNQPQILEAACLESMVLLNRGDHFEAHPLPIEAQFAPSTGICAADFDGDGAQDIFVSQNFFAFDNQTARCDGGRGLLLRGDGHGNFTPMSGDASGVKLYGDQRGCAVGDYDGDGRLDLVVTQNGSTTALFHNISGRTGLRVKLRGPAKNPHAIGAIIRAVMAEGPGAAQQVSAGCGYRSQNSSTILLHAKGTITAVSVHWPGGATKTYPIDSSAREIVLSP